MRPGARKRRSGALVACCVVRLAVLVSGSGTILEAFLEAGLPVALVAADRPCRGLEVAERAGVEHVLVRRESYDAGFDRDAYSLELAGVLAGAAIDLVVMAGFGTIVSEPMHERFGGHILNTHPSLLPAFPGWHAVRDALAAGVKVSGCTVHVAGIEVDTGPILAQEAVEVRPDDDEATLHERIKEVERALYIKTVREILARGRVLP